MKLTQTVLSLSLLLVTQLTDAVGAEIYTDYGPRYFRPTENVETQHIRWAKPLHGGPLKVLFITNHKSTREIVELAQRLDMDYEVFTTEMHGLFAHASQPVEHSREEDYAGRLREVLSATRAYEVIVIANVRWDILPDWSRQEILARVEAGCGLVSLVPESSDSLSENLHANPFRISAKKRLSPFPYLALPEYQSGDVEPDTFMRQLADSYQCGQGRVVRIKGISPPMRQLITPAYEGDPLNVKMLHYDYHLSLAIRWMLWTSRREPAVRVRTNAGTWCRMGDSSIDRAQLQPIQFRLSAAQAGQVRLKFVVRSQENEELFAQTRELNLAKGDHQIQLDLPRLPAGVHFCDLWIQDSTGSSVIDFGTLALEMTSRTHLDEPELISDHFQKETPVSGRVKIHDPTGAEVLVVDRYDNYGRCIGTSSVAIPAAADGSQFVAFQVDGIDARSIRQVVKLQLRRGAETLDTKVKAFSISDLYAPNDIRYSLFASDNGRSYVDVLFLREVSRAGFDSVWSNPDTRWMSPLAARTNLYRMVADFGPSSAVRAVPTDAGPVRYACLTSHKTQAKIEQQAAVLAEHLARFSNRDVSLASEGGFLSGEGDGANACFSASCLADFRRWLEENYGTLDALNVEYQTAYKSWEEIIPVSLSEAKQRTNLLPLWVDHRRHMESVWTGYFEFNTRVFRRMIPSARVGWQCSGSIGRGVTSYKALDYWSLNRAVTMNCNYPGQFAPEAARDFLPPGALVGNDCWGGYEFGRSATFVKWAPWRSLLRGANTFSIFRGLGATHTDNIMTCMAPDLSWYPYMEPGHAEVREIKRGIGKLLMESQRSHDGIAVMYSAASNHVSAFTEGLPTLADTLRAFPYVLEDAGFQYRTVSYQQVADGILRGGEFQVICLPYCQAISVAEADEIRDFVRLGGTVIADLRPGVTDEHGKACDPGILDDVFGVRQATRQARPLRGLVQVDRELGDFRGRGMMTWSDASLAVTTGQAHGKVTVPLLLREGDAAEECPAVVVNRFGRGTALLMNFSISEYGAESGSSSRMRDFVQSAMQLSEVSPPISLTPSTPGIQAHRYQSENSLYVGLLRNPAGVNIPGHDHGARDIAAFQPVPVTISFPQDRHLYEMRSGRYLGLTDRVHQTISDVTAWMLAALPYRVTGIQLTPAEDRIRPGETQPVEINVQTEGDDSIGLHVFHAELLDPNGRSAAGFAHNTVAERGNCMLPISFALNDTPGRWKLVVRDIATGMTATLDIPLTAGRQPVAAAGGRIPCDR